MYYSSGNYEAFARPVKPEGVEHKSAYLVGSGLAALTAACYLVRDGQMPGDHIHILEAMDVAGGACDGIFDPSRGYVMRGGREMEDHFECLWDLFRSIPSLEKRGQRLSSIPGTVPALEDRSEHGCPFYNRCSKRREICEKETPPMVVHKGHMALCVDAKEELGL